MTFTWLQSRWVPWTGTVLALAGTLYLVNLVPPLTQSDKPEVLTTYGPHGPLDTAAYCRENLSGVNCTCFVHKADHVLQAPHVPARGMEYANRWDLARGQAGVSC